MGFTHSFRFALFVGIVHVTGFMLPALCYRLYVTGFDSLGAA